jgi:2-hydroxychromene-2-carboxylate isomerase
MRLADVERQSGISFRWRPFDVAAIMVEMNNFPFSNKPAKARYMWRDLERRAKMHGVAWSNIPPYPIRHLGFINRIAIIGVTEGWCPQFARAAYRRWFVDGQEPSSEPELVGTLREIGQDPNVILERAASAEAKAELNAQTVTVKDLGIFGSPTFVTTDEVFWGDDRLADAIQWHLASRQERR